MRYVILLRGVNVGGGRRVPKAEFYAVLEGLGFSDIVVYINSGNAVASHEHAPTVAAVCATLELHFGFVIPTLMLSAKKAQAIAAAIPPEWTNDSPRPDKSGYKADVLYLFDGANVPTILDQIGYRPEYETMIYVDGAVLAMVSRKNQSRYSLLKVVGTPLYQQMTVRNITTAKKLAALADA